MRSWVSTTKTTNDDKVCNVVIGQLCSNISARRLHESWFDGGKSHHCERAERPRGCHAYARLQRQTDFEFRCDATSHSAASQPRRHAPARHIHASIWPSTCVDCEIITNASRGIWSLTTPTRRNKQSMAADADSVLYSIAAFICALFVLEFGADKFIDHTAILAKRTGIPEGDRSAHCWCGMGGAGRGRVLNSSRSQVTGSGKCRRLCDLQHTWCFLSWLALL